MANDDLELRKRVLGLEADLRELRACVRVLQISLAVLLETENYQAALEQLEHLAQALAKGDPHVSAKREAADVIDALQHLRKRGSTGEDS